MIRVTYARGPMLTDYVMVAPIDFADDSHVALALDVATEAVVGAFGRGKGAHLEDRYFNSGNVEDHVRIAIPSALLNKRAPMKAMRAAVDGLREHFREHVEIVTETMDLKTRTRTPFAVTPAKRKATP